MRLSTVFAITMAGVALWVALCGVLIAISNQRAATAAPGLFVTNGERK